MGIKIMTTVDTLELEYATLLKTSENYFEDFHAYLKNNNLYNHVEFINESQNFRKFVFELEHERSVGNSIE
eukprot:Pgem_evm1s8570